MLNMQKSLSKPFYGLMALPSTAMGFALSIQIAALSAILRDKFNLEIHDIGLVWAAGPISGILVQVIIGLISDKAWFWGGRRRPFIIIGGAISALALLALPNIGVISASLGIEGIIGVALTVVLVLDLSINVGFNPTRAIIADLTPEGEARTRGYTWMQTISGTFGVLAYAIGATMGNIFLIYFGIGLVLAFTLIPALLMEEPRDLAGDTPDQIGFDLGLVIKGTQPLWAVFIYNVYALSMRLMDIERTDYTAEWLCAGATAILMIRVVALKKPTPDASGNDMTEFQKIMAAHSFSWLGVQAMFVFYYPYLEYALPGQGREVWEPAINLSFLTLNAVAAILPALILKPLAEKIPRVRLQAACLAIMAGGYVAAYMFGTSAISLYIIMAVLGIGWAAMVSLPFAIMSQRIEANRMGLFMGVFNLSVVLPQLVVSLGIAMWLQRVEDKGLLFIVAALSLAISSLLWLRVKPLPQAERI